MTEENFQITIDDIKNSVKVSDEEREQMLKELEKFYGIEKFEEAIKVVNFLKVWLAYYTKKILNVSSPSQL